MRREKGPSHPIQNFPLRTREIVIETRLCAPLRQALVSTPELAANHFHDATLSFPFLDRRFFFLLLLLFFFYSNPFFILLFFLPFHSWQRCPAGSCYSLSILTTYLSICNLLPVVNIHNSPSGGQIRKNKTERREKTERRRHQTPSGRLEGPWLAPCNLIPQMLGRKTQFFIFYFYFSFFLKIAKTCKEWAMGTCVGSDTV